MRKVLSLLLVVLMVFSLSGCGEVAKFVTAGLMYKGLEELEEVETEISGVPADFVVEVGEVAEQVLVDDDNVKITFNSFSQDEYSNNLSVNLTIENKLEEAITLSSKNAAVNGYMVDGRYYGTIGLKEIEEVSYSISLIDIYHSGITSIGEIKIGFDNEVSDIECPLLIIRTSLYDTLVDNTRVEGELLLEENGVKVINLGFGDVSYTSFGAALESLAYSSSIYALNLYIENTLEEDVILDVGYCTLNGLECRVNEIITYQGCKNYVPMTFGITYDQNDRESVKKAAALQEKDNVEEIYLVYDIVGVESGRLYAGECTINVN